MGGHMVSAASGFTKCTSASPRSVASAMSIARVARLTRARPRPRGVIAGVGMPDHDGYCDPVFAWLAPDDTFCGKATRRHSLRRSRVLPDMGRRALIVAAAAALAASAPATARAQQLPPTDFDVVAVGTGVPTWCTISTNVKEPFLFSEHWTFSASTDCSVAIEQLSEVWWKDWDGSIVHSACSGFRASCDYRADQRGDLEGVLTHHVKLRAPLGQGWLTDDDCTGAGTDNLDCWFTVS